MSQNITGTFASGQASSVGANSATLLIPSATTTAKLTLSGQIDASNVVKTQKSTNGGQSWTDVATYTTAQTNTSVTVAHGESWRLYLNAQQAGKQIVYSFSVES